MYSYAIDYTINDGAAVDNVGPTLGTRGDYYWTNVTLGSTSTATCGLFMDNTNPTAAPLVLPADTYSTSVLLEWSSNTGSDNSDDTFPGESGIKEYRITRGGSPVVTIPYGTFMFVDDNGGLGFSHNDILDYQLVTVDYAGNQATSSDSTRIQLLIDPPGDWNRVGNPWNSTGIPAANAGFRLDWSPIGDDDPAIDGYSVWRSTSVSSGYASVGSYASNRDYHDETLQADDTYWYRLRSEAGAVTVDSAPISVIHDSAAPLPASIQDVGDPYAPKPIAFPSIAPARTGHSIPVSSRRPCEHGQRRV
jgi:hypothetical protein